MAPASISVVVPTHNRAELLEALLESLSRQSLAADQFEVVVVDDGSTDRTSEVVSGFARSRRLRLRILRQERRGPATARNRGWRAAEAPLLAFIDDDCVATPKWLSSLLAASMSHPGAFLQGRTEIDPAQAAEAGPFSRTLEVTEPGPFYATCNMAYPRELLERLDGFDEAFPVPGGEDTDLGWRARERGAGFAFIEAAVVHHAVVQLGPLGKLRWALHWSDAMQTLGRHPELRMTLAWGLFWKRSHADLVLALLGLALARRFGAVALLLVLPYARSLRARCLADGSDLTLMPYLALYDATETFAVVRGALRHRVLVF